MTVSFRFINQFVYIENQAEYLASGPSLQGNFEVTDLEEVV